MPVLCLNITRVAHNKYLKIEERANCMPNLTLICKSFLFLFYRWNKVVLLRFIIVCLSVSYY